MSDPAPPLRWLANEFVRENAAVDVASLSPGEPPAKKDDPAARLVERVLPDLPPLPLPLPLATAELPESPAPVFATRPPALDADADLRRGPPLKLFLDDAAAKSSLPPLAPEEKAGPWRLLLNPMGFAGPLDLRNRPPMPPGIVL